jgi:hypothetical protein
MGGLIMDEMVVEKQSFLTSNGMIALYIAVAVGIAVARRRA